MTKLFIANFLCALSINISIVSFAQNTNDPADIAFWGNIETFLDKQAASMLDLINFTLEKYPPIEGQPLPRKLALYNLDAILHDQRYDQSTVVHNFMASRMNSVLEGLSHPLIEGMQIYKLYNDGFIVRTKSVTVAFDFYRGNTFVKDSLAKAIVDNCDILLITHSHSDHADKKVAEMFINEGKPVWGPSNLWENNTAIHHIRKEKVIKEETWIRGRKMEVKILPGHQEELINNIYELITPEGFSIIHTGDQYSEKDMEWISGIKEQVPDLDVLLVNCWTLRIAEFVDYFDPKLVITGHENEMGHSIDHREPYWLSFKKMEKINKPYVLMTWGEQYKYTR